MLSDRQQERLLGGNYDETALVRQLFGPAARPLTVPWARQHLGQTVHALNGQYFMTEAMGESKAKRARHVRPIKLLRVSDGGDGVWVEVSGGPEGTVFYEMYDSGGGELCQGSGEDPVYVFG